jgi:hypothetical protein
MEVLKRYRTGGQQKVTVEHVTVQAGGQAIVGNVTHPGGGVPEKTRDQPDEQPKDSLGNASEPSMLCPIEADRQGLSGSCCYGVERLPVSWGRWWWPARQGKRQLPPWRFHLRSHGRASGLGRSHPAGARIIEVDPKWMTKSPPLISCPSSLLQSDQTLVQVMLSADHSSVAPFMRSSFPPRISLS